MVSAASFVAAFFEGHWFLGTVLGLFAMYLSLRLIDAGRRRFGWGLMEYCMKQHRLLSFI